MPMRLLQPPWHSLLEYTIPHTPQQNGVTERANQTLTKWMRAMMKDMDCPTALWGEAVCTAAYCLNHIPTSANGGITLIQAFDGTTPDISHMRIFYTDMYIHHSKSDGAKKLGDRACKVKFVGYPEGVSGYRFYDPCTRTIVLSRSTHFLESKHPPTLPTQDRTPLPEHNDTCDSCDPDTASDDNISVAPDDSAPPPTRNDHPPSTQPSPSPTLLPSLMPSLPPSHLNSLLPSNLDEQLAR